MAVVEEECGCAGNPVNTADPLGLPQTSSDLSPDCTGDALLRTSEFNMAGTIRNVIPGSS